MKKEYTYEITENGYYILVNGKKVIHQYEPFIPDRNLSYEENAEAQIKEMKINDYAQEIVNENMTIEEVSEEYKEEVQKILKNIEKVNLQEPVTKKELLALENSITETELALAEIYETMLGGVE